jgi:hypothetical protein
VPIPEPQQPASTQDAGQGPGKPVKIALVLYPRFTALDIIGPFQALAGVPGYDTVFVAAESGPVIDDTGRCRLGAGGPLPRAGVRGTGLPHLRGPHGDAGARRACGATCWASPTR